MASILWRTISIYLIWSDFYSANGNVVWPIIFIFNILLSDCGASYFGEHDLISRYIFSANGYIVWPTVSLSFIFNILLNCASNNTHYMYADYITAARSVAQESRLVLGQ